MLKWFFSRLRHLNSVRLVALFNQQTLYDRQLAVRMDKWVDPVLQEIPTKMPSGLQSLGVGFGAAGLPLANIAQISSQPLDLVTYLNNVIQVFLSTNNTGFFARDYPGELLPPR